MTPQLQDYRKESRPDTYTALFDKKTTCLDGQNTLTLTREEIKILRAKQERINNLKLREELISAIRAQDDAIQSKAR